MLTPHAQQVREIAIPLEVFKGKVDFAVVGTEGGFLNKTNKLKFINNKENKMIFRKNEGHANYNTYFILRENTEEIKKENLKIKKPAFSDEEEPIDLSVYPPLYTHNKPQEPHPNEEELYPTKQPPIVEGRSSSKKTGRIRVSYD